MFILEVYLYVEKDNCFYGKKNVYMQRSLLILEVFQHFAMHFLMDFF
jgi:hypothetical protein